MTAIALAMLLVTAAPAAPAPESDADTAKARAAFQWAQRLYKEARYASAIEKFEEAYRLKPHPSILFNIGRCYEQLGEIPRALRSYKDYLKQMPDAKDKEAVTSAIVNLERRMKDDGVQQLMVYTDPVGALVTIDDKVYGSSPAAVELKPGNHMVKIQYEGYVPVARSFVMSADKSVELSFALKAEPAKADKKNDAVADSGKTDKGNGKTDKAETTPDVPRKDEPAKVSDTRPTETPVVAATAPPPQTKKGGTRIFTWVAGGVALAGLGAGIGLGAAAGGASAEMLGSTHDTEKVQQLHDSAQGMAIASNISYGVAGAALITGVILFFVEGGKPAPAQ